MIQRILSFIVDKTIGVFCSVICSICDFIAFVIATWGKFKMIKINAAGILLKDPACRFFIGVIGLFVSSIMIVSGNLELKDNKEV